MGSLRSFPRSRHVFASQCGCFVLYLTIRDKRLLTLGLVMFVLYIILNIREGRAHRLNGSAPGDERKPPPRNLRRSVTSPTIDLANLSAARLRETPSAPASCEVQATAEVAPVPSGWLHIKRPVPKFRRLSHRTGGKWRPMFCELVPSPTGLQIRLESETISVGLL